MVNIDKNACIGCGECVRVCPRSILEVRDGIAELLTGNSSQGSSKGCMECGHCRAVCPADAIFPPGDDPVALKWETFTCDHTQVEFGRPDTSELVRFMRSRRSCRNYLPDPVDEALLRDLVRIGITAPSGTNSQKWTFTLIPDRAALMAWGDRIGVFFRKLNGLADKAWLRNGLKLMGKSTLADYHRDHAASVRRALDLWEKDGTDQLFHGATAAILVGAAPGASCPAEDALLATQNILLGAHSMGLGTCLIGYAVEAARHDAGIKSFLSIPEDEEVYAVIALGKPDLKYRRTTGRRAPVVRIFRP